MLEHDLAEGVLASHPLETARVLEGLEPGERARFLGGSRPDRAAACLRVMHAPAAADTLRALDPELAGRIVAAIPQDVAALYLRRLDDREREAILGEMGGRAARSLRSLLRFAPETAGAMMDPDVLAVPIDLSVGEATERVRQAAGDARYNLYAVDAEQRLVGAFNLRELFLAEDHARLASIAHTDPYRIPAGADRHAIVSHPGWLAVHSLPVVDDAGRYLGAIRYRTLRRIEAQLQEGRQATGATARALGDLFRTGATSVIEAVASSTAPALAVQGAPDDVR